MRSYYDIPFKEIIEELNEEKLPPAFVDRFQIALPTDPKVQAITQELQRIVNKIITSNPDKINPQFKPRIYLSLEEVDNAFTIPSVDKAPLIIITAEILKKVKSEDELAGILSHEIHHNLIGEKIGKEQKQGQLGECACDCWAVEVLRNAGYQAKGFADFFAREKVIKDHWLSRILGSHPSSETRFMNINNMEIALNSQKGKVNLKDKPLTPKDSSLIKNLRDIKFATEFQKELNKQGYSPKNNKLQQVNIILDVLKSGTLGKPHNAGIYDREQISTKLAQIITEAKPVPEKDNSAYFAKLQELRDWLIQSGYEVHNRDELIRTLNNEMNSHALYNKNHLTQFGNALSYLVEERKELDEKNYLEIKSQASLIVNLLNQTYHTPEAQKYFIEKYRYTSFLIFSNPDPNKIQQLQEGEFITPSWDSVVRAAEREYKENNTTYIASALYAIGMTFDPRLKPMREKLLLDTPIFTYPIDDQLRKKDLFVSSEGKIINFAAVNRQMQEEKLLQQINWDELYSPPKGLGFSEFVKKYHHWLTIVKEPVFNKKLQTDYVFMSEFLDRLIALPPSEKIAITYNYGNRFENFVNNILPKFSKDEERMSFSINVPIIKFLLDDAKGKMFYMSQSRFEMQQANIICYYCYDSWLAGYKKHLTIPEFKTPNDLNNYMDKSPLNIKANDLALAEHTLNSFQFWSSNISIMPNELIFFDKLKSKNYSYPHKQFPSSLEHLKKAMVQKQLDTPLTDEQLKMDVNLCRALSLVDKDNLFQKSFFADNTHLHNYLLAKIINEYKNFVGTPEEKIKLLEQIIISDPNMESKINNFNYGYNLNFPDPKHKDFFIEEYTQQLAEFCNKFRNDPPEFEKQAKLIVDKIIAHTDLAITQIILVKLADKITAQRDLSTYIENKLNERKSDLAKENLNTLEFSFRGLETICSAPRFRNEFLEFLLAYPSYENCEKAFNTLKTVTHKYDSKFDENAYSYFLMLHKNFWHLDPVGRAAIFQKLLYSQGGVDEKVSPKELGEQVKRKVFNIVLDKNEKDATNVITAYIDASTEAEKTAILSMMLATQEPSQNSARKTNGHILKMVLENLGPAGTKLAQAIHSNPQTPKDIKDDMASSKSMANKPSRWDLFKLLDECYGADQAKHIQVVGDILGAGAYGVTVKIKKDNEKEVALTLLRSHAHERAKTEFTTLEKAAKLLIKKDNKFAPVALMLEQANRASDEETQMNLAARQDTIAQELYNNVQIKIGDEKTADTYTFFTAEWLGHGERYKETAIVPGVHFSDMPETTAEEKAAKSKAALAILTIELRNLLSGNEFDHDRHGAQQRIFGNYIGQFDFGGVSIEKPNDNEKRLIGKLFGKVLRNIKEEKQNNTGIDFVDTFHKTLLDEGKNNYNRHFLAKLERAVLALNDYIHYVDKKLFPSVLGAALYKADDLIANHIGHGLVGGNAIIGFFYKQKGIDQLSNFLIENNVLPIEIKENKKQNLAARVV